MMAFLARWAAFLAVSATAILLLTSQLFETTDPKLALAINPTSADARVKLVIQQLTSNPAQNEAALAASLAGLQYHRLDSRFLSLAGLAQQATSRPADAEAYFRAALAISPTEFQALSAIMRLDLVAGRNAEAAGRLDILTRRWGSQIDTYLPLVPAIVSDASGIEAIRTLFAVENARRDLVVRGLLEVDAATGIASELVANWSKAGVPDRVSLANQVTGKLLKLKQDQAAYLFHLNFGGSNGSDNSYVKNGTFEKKPDRSAFDWMINAQRGVNITLNDTRGAQILFLDSPVQLDNLSQLIALAPGKHALALEYSTQNLKAPAPVRFEVRCRSGKLLGAVAFDGPTLGSTKAGIVFEVPPADCVLQRVAVTSDKLPESWQNRYSGNITLRYVEIERIEQ
jgi:tetratricopeptide (TPR) repeat protein